MSSAGDPIIYAFRRNLVVTASAGTGKTFRLTALYVLLVLGLTSRGEGDDVTAAPPVLPTRIAATTFSRSAAVEIRERVDALLRAVANDAFDRSTEAYRAVLNERIRLVGAPPLDSRAMRDRANAALAVLPGALIDTLHGLSGRIVRRIAFDLGITPSFRVEGEDEARASADVAVEEGLRAALEQGQRGAMDLIDASGNVALCRRKITDLLDRADEEGVAVRDLQCTDMAARARVVVAELQEICRALVAQGSRNYREVAAGVVRALERWESAPGSEQELASVLEPLFTKHKPSKPLPCEEAFTQFRDAIRGDKNSEKARQLAAFIVSAHLLGARTRAMADILSDIAGRRDAARQQGGTLGFGDLLRLARDALRDRPDLAAQVRTEFDVVLVDEFQDTSRVQRDLLYLLRERSETAARRPKGALPEASDLLPSGLLVVGDRKQSIYGFRGADVTVFAEVAADLAGASAVRALGLKSTVEVAAEPNAELVTLSENRRSHPSILQFVNCFAAADFARGNGSLFDLSYAPSEHLFAAHPAGESNDGTARVVLIDDRDDAPEDASALVRTARGPMRDALLGAGAVHELVASGGHACREIAVLARRRATLPLLEFALSRLGVAYVVAGRGLFETREVRDVAALLRWMLDPSNRHALATVLRGPSLGLTEGSLVALCEPGRGLTAPNAWFGARGAAARLEKDERDRLQRFESRFREVQRCSLGLPPADAIRVIVQAFDLDRVIASLPHAPQRLGNLDRLVGLAAARGGSLPAFVRWLDRQIADQADESEAAVVSESDDAVTLMTVHASKGLEFPVVVLVDAAAAPRAEPLSMAIARGKHGEGARLVVRHTREIGGTLYTPEATEFSRGATAREIAERRRITYVAMTRAKEKLIVIAPSATPPGSAAATLRPLLPDVQAACPGTVVIPAGRLLAGDASPGGDRPARVEARTLPVLPAPRGPISISATPLGTFADCPRKYHLTQELGFEVPAWQGARPTLLSGQLDDVRTAGTAAHRVLERWPLEAWGKATESAAVEQRMLRELPVGRRVAVSDVAQRVARFLSGTYAARVREARAVLREEPFCFELGPKDSQLVVRGTIDLLVIHPDGSGDVVDYKSSGRADAARWFQLRVYALAARKLHAIANIRPFIVDLSSPGDPAPDTAPIAQDELDAFEQNLLALREELALSRRRGHFAMRERGVCEKLKCGFIATCYAPSALGH